MANDRQTENAAPGGTCAADGSAVSVGQTYALRHCRFGRAIVTVTAIPDETWIDVEVVSGTMRGMGAGAVWGPGDSKRVRREHCIFTPNDPLPLQGGATAEPCKCESGCSAWDIINTLRHQSAEIAVEGHSGWGNVMIVAADEIEHLLKTPSTSLLADAIKEIKKLHCDLGDIAGVLNAQRPHKASGIVIRALRTSRKIVAEIEANAGLDGRRERITNESRITIQQQIPRDRHAV